VRLKPTALLTGPYDWDPAVVPAQESESRLANVQRVLAAREVSALIVHGNSAEYGALAYLTGLVPKLGPAFALIGRDSSGRVLVSGSPTMLGAAKRLTWIEDVRPIGDLKSSVSAWLTEIPRREPVNVGLWGHYSMALRPYNAIQSAIEPRGRILEIDAALEVLRLRKSSLEQDLCRQAARILGESIAELARAHAAGDGARSSCLAAECAAFRLGAQDARTLASARNGGPPVILDVAANDSNLHPLLTYVAVRFAGYWAEGFTTLARSATGALSAAQLGLDAMLQSSRAGISLEELTSIATQHVRPYRLHPFVESSIANGIGLSIEEPCDKSAPEAAVLQSGGVYTLRCGAASPSDSATVSDNAIVSAMIAVHEQGMEVLWSAPRRAGETLLPGNPR
jgi:Xaa-Pro aminopeptidase